MFQNVHAVASRQAFGQAIKENEKYNVAPLTPLQELSSLQATLKSGTPEWIEGYENPNKGIIADYFYSSAGRIGLIKLTKNGDESIVLKTPQSKITYDKEGKAPLARRLKALFVPDSELAIKNALRTSYTELRNILVAAAKI